MITFFWKGRAATTSRKLPMAKSARAIKLELGEAGAAEDDAGGMLMCSVLGFI